LVDHVPAAARAARTAGFADDRLALSVTALDAASAGERSVAVEATVEVGLAR
jgi:hypothetical protein